MRNCLSSQGPTAVLAVSAQSGVTSLAQGPRLGGGSAAALEDAEKDQVAGLAAVRHAVSKMSGSATARPFG